MNILRNITTLFVILILNSCFVQKKNVYGDSESTVLNSSQKKYLGWWIYGEGQHIFKDENSLAEYNLKFLNENLSELEELYLAICEMEYLPLECAMIGFVKNDSLCVSEFEILYVKGCED